MSGEGRALIESSSSRAARWRSSLAGKQHNQAHIRSTAIRSAHSPPPLKNSTGYMLMEQPSSSPNKHTDSWKQNRQQKKTTKRLGMWRHGNRPAFGISFEKLLGGVISHSLTIHQERSYWTPPFAYLSKIRHLLYFEGHALKIKYRNLVNFMNKLDQSG